MIKDLIIHDDFYSDYREVIALARKQDYFAPTEKDNWSGMRSGLLNEILTESELHLLAKPITDKIFHDVLKGSGEYTFSYKLKLYFHWLDENVKHKPSFFHQDRNLMAGVVYLSESPQASSGTTILVNDEKIEVENRCNRCVLYNSNFYHAAMNGFGKSVEDARLVLTVFFDEIHITKPVSH